MNIAELEHMVEGLNKRLKLEEAINRINIGYILVNTCVTVANYMRR